MKIGVALFSFNRPEYFQEQIKSIEKSSYLDDYEFHLFQDGWVNHANQHIVAQPNDILTCISLFEQAKLPIKNLHSTTINKGIAINQYEGLKELCNQYEAVMLVEDDVVISPHWFRLAKILLQQYKDNAAIYSFSPNFKKYGTELNTIISGNYHHWLDVFWSERWLKIEPLFLQYYEIIKNIDYRYRPHTEIIKFFEKVGNPQKGVTSQDSAKYWALTKMGMKRCFCQINRAISIGKKGQHFTEEFYYRNKFHEQEPYIFEEDEILSEFKLDET